MSCCWVTDTESKIITSWKMIAMYLGLLFTREYYICLCSFLIHIVVNSSIPIHIVVNSSFPIHIVVNSSFPIHIVVNSSFPIHIVVNSYFPIHIVVNSSFPIHIVVNSSFTFFNGMRYNWLFLKFCVEWYSRCHVKLSFEWSSK